jgi:hypothetical protein
VIYYQKWSTDSMQSPSSFQFILHINRNKRNPKIYMDSQRPWIVKPILSKKSNAGYITIPDFKLYYRVIVTKVTWYLHRNRCTDQQNRIKEPEIGPTIYSHLIFNKDPKICWQKHNLFYNSPWKTRFLYVKF